MVTNHQARTQRVIASVTLAMTVLLGISAAAGQDTGPSAQAILDATEFQGGFCVIVRPGDGKLAVDLARDHNVVVQGISPDANEVHRCRKYILSQKCYGQVTVRTHPLNRLPYATNIANLVILNGVADQEKADVPLREVYRVVSPEGFAFITGAQRATVQSRLDAAGLRDIDLQMVAGGVLIKKPRPAGMDDWTQRNYNAARTSVSQDTTLTHINTLNWVAGPYWPLGRDYQRGNAGVVSANGRNFYLSYNVADNMHKSPFDWEKQYYLQARDAFNGVLLWSIPTEIGFQKEWEPKRNTDKPGYVSTNFEPGEARMADNLVAADDRVFTVIKDQVVSVDAKTGSVLKTFCQGPYPRRLLHVDRKLIVVGEDAITAFDSETARSIWSTEVSGDAVAGDGRVFCFSNKHHQFICLDLDDGKQQWTATTDKHLEPNAIYPFYYKNDKLVFTIGKRQFHLHVYSAKDGKLLWDKKTDARNAHFAAGLIWAEGVGLDPATGEEKRQLPLGTYIGTGCAPYTGTEKYFVGTRPTKTVDLTTGEMVSFPARHPCRTGNITALGMVYGMPQGCARCAAGSIRGYVAIGTDSADVVEDQGIDDDDRLVQDPAFETANAVHVTPTSRDWPTYRHDNLRSCVTKQTVPSRMKLLWEVQVDDQHRPRSRTLNLEWLSHRIGGDRITAPTIARGRIFIAVPESHQIVAFDAQTRAKIWSYVAEGRLDTPPTLAGNRCLFSDAAGWVHCVNSDDGQLMWRFNAAVKDKTIMAFGQPESVNPAVGGVLVEGDTAYFVSGRARGADGGINFFKVNLTDGKMLGTQNEIPKSYAEPDLLVSNGVVVRMCSNGMPAFTIQRGQSPDQATNHLYCIRPVLNRVWRYHGGRSRQLDRKWMNKHYFYGHVGQVAIGDPETTRTFVYKFTWQNYETTYHHSLEAMAGDIMYWDEPGNVGVGTRDPSADIAPKWRVHVAAPAQVEAMVLAGKTLFAAGPVDKYQRDQGGFLHSFNPGDGRKINEWSLSAPPVADGIAVADGRMYVALQNGKLACLGDK